MRAARLLECVDVIGGGEGKPTVLQVHLPRTADEGRAAGTAGADATSDLWWRNAVIYCLDVETFLDTDGDGCGDLRGLTERVDYLNGLGVSCIWLMPFYPTPNRDDGYDVSDFYDVDRRLGDLGDLVAFVRTAQDRGIRVIADLVVNHTSAEHPWFQAARADRNSPFRDFYVWADEPPENAEEGIVFPDAEDSVWEWDDVAGQYYLHRFYRHQPDLNITNPRVRDEIAKMIGFWLQLGLSGFRVDAVPFLIEADGVQERLAADPHDYLRAVRGFLQRRKGDAILLGEVNLPADDLRRYFGDQAGDQLTMCFNFLANQALYLALARGSSAPLRDTLAALPEVPPTATWGNFVRNHDELTLDKLSEDERQEVFAAFGPDPGMQLFGRGLRRRLPSMVGGDQRRLRLAYSLVFALPGTPVLFYGEEIGMAENLAIDGRLSVRTPMQWDAGATGGFSSAPPGALRRPLPDGEFGPGTVNVAAQRRDPESLLNWMERLIRRRKECPELGMGAGRALDVGDDAVLALRADWGGRALVTLHNLADRDLRVAVPLEEGERLTEVFGDAERGDPEGGAVELAPYGFRWFRIVGG